MDAGKERDVTPGAATTERAGLRERKAASTRLAVARSLWKRLDTTPLAEIRVEDLAADANVSRMTFFNYFATKEHALDLVLAIWMFDLQADLERKALRGVAGIERLFARLGDFVAENPERMRRFMGVFVTRPADRTFPMLGKLEQAELAPDLVGRDVEPRTLGQMFVALVEEARAARELAIEGTPYELAHYLGALANGAAMVGHSNARETDWALLFRRHVRRALGLPLPRGTTAPRTPAPYRGSKPKSKATSVKALRTKTTKTTKRTKAKATRRQEGGR